MADEGTLILSALGDLRSDVKDVSIKLDVIANKTERHDARIDTLERQITQFVPMGQLDERRAAFEGRLHIVEDSVKTLVSNKVPERLVTWGIAIMAVVVAGFVGIWHPGPLPNPVAPTSPVIQGHK